MRLGIDARFSAFQSRQTSALAVDSSARNRRMTIAISIADLAASPPRLNLAGPARSIACSTVSVVNTPKMIGTSASSAACPIPRLASAQM